MRRSLALATGLVGRHASTSGAWALLRVPPKVAARAQSLQGLRSDAARAASVLAQTVASGGSGAAEGGDQLVEAALALATGGGMLGAVAQQNSGDATLPAAAAAPPPVATLVPEEKWVIGSTDCTGGQAFYCVEFTEPTWDLDEGQKTSGWRKVPIAHDEFAKKPGRYTPQGVREALAGPIAQANVLGLGIGENGNDDELPLHERDLLQTVSSAVVRYGSSPLVGRLVVNECFLVYKNGEIVWSKDVARPSRDEVETSAGLPTGVPADKLALFKGAKDFAATGVIKRWFERLRAIDDAKAAQLAEDAKKYEERLQKREDDLAAAHAADWPATGWQVCFTRMSHPADGSSSTAVEFKNVEKLKDAAARAGFEEVEYSRNAWVSESIVWYLYPQNRITVVPDAVRFEEKVSNGSWKPAANSGRLIRETAFQNLVGLAAQGKWVIDTAQFFLDNAVFVRNPKNKDGLQLSGCPIAVRNPKVHQDPAPKPERQSSRARKPTARDE